MDRLELVREGGMAATQPVTPVLLHVRKTGDFSVPNKLETFQKARGAACRV